MSPYDLTTLANVKAWLGLPSPPTPSDTTLSPLITAASRAIYAMLSRPSLLRQSYTDIVRLEGERVFLNQWPVQSVVSVTLDGLTLPAVTPGEYALGYWLSQGDAAPPGRPQAIELSGVRTERRRMLIVNYFAGYFVQNEAASVPAAPPFMLSAAAPFGPWAQDIGVAYAGSGAVLQAVVGSAAAGRYSCSNGVYTFSAADAGATVSLSYSFVPQDLVQAATEFAAERFRASDRIGLRSKSVGGQETIAYDVSAVPSAVVALIAAYKRAAF